MSTGNIDLIDIGANLTHDSFDRDRDAVMNRARAAGIRRMIVTGTSVSASEQAIALAGNNPGRLFATAGLHPHHAAEFSQAAQQALLRLAGQPEVVAVGECGLDYFRDFSPRDAQQRAFEAQLEIAAEVGKPVFLHQRDAHDDFLGVLRHYLPAIPGGVAHCFTGNAQEMREYLDLGLYVGITGWICDERRGQALREAVRELPLDRILLETDAPYLVPRDLSEQPKGRRNEPALLAHVLVSTAGFMGIDAGELGAAATANSERLFRLASR